MNCISVSCNLRLFCRKCGKLLYCIESEEEIESLHLNVAIEKHYWMCNSSSVVIFLSLDVTFNVIVEIYLFTRYIFGIKMHIKEYILLILK